MRILITGCDGQVGWECKRSLQVLGEIAGAARAQCDFAHPGAIRTLVRATRPDLIVNAAAYTAVDRAEEESDLAYAVNAVAPAILAEEAGRLGASLIHLSTDYVFDGAKPTAYAEDDPCNPLSVYGRTKLQGEQAVLASGATALILRTSWVYALRGRNFLRTILRLAREREELRIVDDQWGAPTWARSIAEGVAGIVARAGRDRATLATSFEAHGGVFHMTAAGRTNWHHFAECILERIPDPKRRVRSIVAIPSRDYVTAAPRPSNSVLDNSRLSREWAIRMPNWDAALGWAVEGSERS